MTAPEIPPPAPRRSWGRIALVAAFALSLLCNSIALGAWLRWRDVRDDLLGPQAAAARLPDEMRQDLRRALRADMGTIRPLLRDVVEARAAVVAAATATPYDREVTETAMQDFRTKVDVLLIEVQRVFLDQLDAKAGQEN
jgi:uncharacterized membrane protein